MTSSTLRSNTRSNGSSSPTVLVLDTTPGVSSTYTARLQSPYSSEYGKLVDTTLRQNVGPQPPHTCTVLALGPTDKAVDAERHHYLECKKTFIHVKLRELMTALLSGLCGVKHPNTALPDGLYPRTHFMEWLREAFHPRDKVFTIQQRPPTLLQPSNLQGNPTTETSPAQVPLIVGGASALCFGQLVSIFDGLGGLSSHANEVVHSLTVGEVVRVLADPAALQILGETAIRCLINLIEAIIGSTIQEVKSDWDSRLARRQFKAEARDFRRKIRNTALLTTIEDVWKPNFEEAAAESQIKSLITRNLVVTPSQYETLENQHNTLQEEHNTLQTEHNKLQTEHNTLQKEHNKLQTEHNKLQTEHNALKEDFRGLKEDHTKSKDGHAKTLSTLDQVLERLANLERKMPVLN